MKPINARTPRLFFAALLALAGLLSITPPSTATPDEWTTENLATVIGPVAPSALRSETARDDGEKIGVAFFTASTSAIRFMLKPDADSPWVMKNTDVTGATVATSEFQLASDGGDNWVILVDAASNHKFYYSTDDGATWTFGIERFCNTCNEAIHSLVADGGSAFVLDSLSTGPLAFRFVDDYKTGTFSVTPFEEGSHSESISDNQGGNTAATQTINVIGADLLTTSPGLRVWFHGTDGQSYFVSSGDGYFWTIPYTTAGGSTKAPILPHTNCPGIALTSGGTSYVSVAGTGGTDYVALFRTQDGANNAYLCSSSPSATDAYPSSAPSTAQTQPVLSPTIATNGFGQYIATARENTLNYVIYKSSPAAPWELVYSAVNAATDVFAVTATPTKAYFFYLDNSVGGQLTVASSPMPPEDGQGQDSWCSNPNSLNYGGDPDADFGYNYAEDVSFFTDPDDTGFGPIGESEMSNGFEFKSTDDDPAFLGKGWEVPGASTVRTTFRIEAGQENLDSRFRVVHSFVALTPSSVTKGNSENTQSFSDTVEAEFKEVGNDWEMSIWFTNGGGTRTKVGASALSFDPNSPHTFRFDVNTTGNGYARIVDAESGGTIVNRSMVGSGLAGFTAFAGDDRMYAQWFVTEGSDVIIEDVFTYLDDPFGDGSIGATAQNSSCLQFYPSVVVTGDLGSIAPGDIVDLDDIDGDGVPNESDPDADGDGLCNGADDLPPGTTGAEDGCIGGDTDDDNDLIPDGSDDTPLGGDDTGDEGGFNGTTSAALMGFLGIVLVASFAASMNERTGAGAVGIVVFSLLGLFVAYFLNYIELWVVVAFTIMGLAICFLGIKSMASGDGL